MLDAGSPIQWLPFGPCAGADALRGMGSTKRQVQTAFFDAGLTLEREALNTFVGFVEENGGDEELVYSLLDSSVQGVASNLDCSDFIEQCIVILYSSVFLTKHRPLHTCFHVPQQRWLTMSLSTGEVSRQRMRAA